MTDTAFPAILSVSTAASLIFALYIAASWMNALLIEIRCCPSTTPMTNGYCVVAPGRPIIRLSTWATASIYVVESELIVELKSVNQLQPIHQAQLLTYLKLAKKKLGLLINFNVPVIKHGIVRVIN